MKVSLSAQHIVKHYGGVVALADGNLTVQSGEVVALLGANGSGKSTLSKIITGVVSPNDGKIYLDDAPVSFPSPQAARRAGIAAVYQELSLVPDMTVAENIWLGNEPLTAGIRVNRRRMLRETEALLDNFAGTFHASLDPEVLVSGLPPDERQIVEILKALSKNPRLMILDEATASLGSQQVARLFELIEDWKAGGMAIVFVSHRMDEIFRIADRAAVLRNGYHVGDREIGETNERELVSLMVESQANPHSIRVRAVPKDAPVRLRVEQLKTNVLRGIDLEVRDGELLGIGGLQGQGQSDLLLALFGAIPHSGHIILSGEPVRFNSPRSAMKRDVAYVPGDRGSEGLLLIRSILENLHLPSWRRYGLPLNMRGAYEAGERSADNLRLVRSSLDAPVSSLSGGNAQKVVIGKWLLRDPRLLLLNDPTKGIDVSTKGEFYELLARLCAEGTAILFYSSDDEELLGLCERVLVLHDGQISAELQGETLDRTHLVAASMGFAQEGNIEPD